MRIHIIAQGSFGPAVASRIEQLSAAHHTVTTTRATPSALMAACWPAADLRVLITGRESRKLVEYVDRCAHEERTDFLSISRDHPRLFLGPLVLPGRTACATCACGRADQHDAARAASQPLRDAYDRDLDLEPGGFLPSHVGMAAAYALEIAEELHVTGDSERAGTISQVNLHDGSMRRSTVVGIHGCPRCRKTPPLSESSWQNLTHLGLSAVGEQRG